ncbi:rCG41582 [Rattus norvegicus]|uniref:RCG41582 n=1 Tax=Rattus norvegicus TaxID=10116 RepID=A6IH51_RAT|nr:rCG41582 [Rattus norvegicus]
MKASFCKVCHPPCSEDCAWPLQEWPCSLITHTQKHIRVILHFLSPPDSGKEVPLPL